MLDGAQKLADRVCRRDNQSTVLCDVVEGLRCRGDVAFAVAFLVHVCLRASVSWLLSFVVKLRHGARKICLICTQHKLAKVQCPRQWHFVRPFISGAAFRPGFSDTRHTTQVNAPRRITSAMQAGARFTYHGGMEG